ncbi:MAG: hypothetical protein QXS24_03435 [Desulfurococcaceae archaeon]
MSQAQIRRGSEDRREFPRMPLRRALYYAFRMPRDRGAIIYGEPGIGKSTLVLNYAYEEARQLGKEIIDTSLLASAEKEKIDAIVREVRRNPEKYYVVSFIKLGSALPDDIMPTPHIYEIRDEERGLVTQVELPVFKLSLQLLTIPNIYGCLILDDVTNISDPYKKDFVAGVFGERKLGGTSGVAISKNVRVIGTGNLPEHSELAHPMPEIMVGRAWQVVVDVDNLETWYQAVKTAYGDAFDDDVYVFLKRYPQYAQNLKLMHESPRVGTVLRSWTLLALMLKTFREDVERAIAEGNHEEPLALFAGAVGLEASYQFFTFLSKRVPSIEEVLVNPSKIQSEIAGDLDVAFRFAMQIAHRLEKVLTRSAEAQTERTVEVNLGNGVKHTVSLNDPYVYLVLLADVMQATTSDIASFVVESMSSSAVREFQRVVRKAILQHPSKADEDTPQRMWREKVKKAGEVLREFLVSVGITSILLNT